MDYREKINHRADSNTVLLSKLEDYLKQHSDQRFGQALVNLGIIQILPDGSPVDPFYEEPIDTLNRVNNK